MEHKSSFCERSFGTGQSYLIAAFCEIEEPKLWQIDLPFQLYLDGLAPLELGSSGQGQFLPEQAELCQEGKYLFLDEYKLPDNTTRKPAR